MERTNTDNLTAGTVKKWAFIAILVSLPVAILVGHYVDPGRGRAAGLALALMIGAVRAFWYLRRHPWFWMSVAAMTLIHVVLIILVPWSNKSFPAPALWPIAIADFAAVCGFFKLVEKAMSRENAASSQE